MIGIRPLVSTAGAVVLVAVALSPTAPNPVVELRARAILAERAARADAALVALEEALAPGVELARRASARTVAGEDQPGPVVGDAAAALRGAIDAADRARDAFAALDGARRAWRGSPEALQPPVPPGELDSIAGQLEAAADDADAFFAMRQRTEQVTAALDAALDALAGGDLAGAAAWAREARDAHEAVAAWNVDLATLPIWIEATDEMIGIVEQIVAAAEAGDSEAAEAAAQELESLSSDAASADRALRIAIGEGGSAVLSAPLDRLAAVLDSVETARRVAASIGRTADG